VPWSTLALGLDPGECPGSDVAHDGVRDGRAEPSAEPAVLAGFGPIEAPLGHDLVAGMIGRHDVQWRFRVDGADGELHRIGVLPRPRDRDDLRRCLEQIRHTALAKSGPPVEAGPRRRTPGPALSRWIRARDGTCRAPGCRVPASVCDIDHTVDHFSGGLTTHDNLALLCRHHHRLKHEAGWHVQQPRPGALVWTSPYGQRFGRPAD
ncbi:MAG TPA: HNH endonuclease signature motif containing protein, partial [Micromonosporaceae bacterium]|nr:HNH endonuclease signature motif containing protein [Micromonosporaceae bacterium]